MSAGRDVFADVRAHGRDHRLIATRCSPQQRDQTVAEHGAVYQAIAAHDPAAARSPWTVTRRRRARPREGEAARPNLPATVPEARMNRTRRALTAPLLYATGCFR